MAPRRGLVVTAVVLGAVAVGVGLAVAGLYVATLVHRAANVSAVEVARAVDDEVRLGGVAGATPARCPSGLRAEVGRSVRCSVSVDGQPVDVIVTVTAVGGPDRIGYDIRLEPNPVPRAVLERKVAEIVAGASGTPPGATTCTGDLPPTVGLRVFCTVTSADGQVEMSVATTGVDGGMIRFGIRPR